MKLLTSIRHFLFPFEQENVEVPLVEPTTPKYRYIKRRSTVDALQELPEFDASDCFLYLNHL